jgi:hypothetical protein
MLTTSRAVGADSNRINAESMHRDRSRKSVMRAGQLRLPYHAAQLSVAQQDLPDQSESSHYESCLFSDESHYPQPNAF